MKEMKRICAFVLCFLMVVALIPATALAADPVITNLSVTRESETKATLSFHSAASGYIYITVKDSDELTPFTFFMPIGDGEQVITLVNDPMTPWFTNAGEAQVAVCFGNTYQELNTNLANHNNDHFAAEGVVTATIPAATNSDAPEEYDLWVNGTQVTSDNAGNVLGDDTVSYDAASTTLTLNGANLTNAQHTDYNITAVIFADQSIGTLTINSVGQNTISATASGITAGIYCYGDIVFTGSDSLTVTANSTGSEGNAVYAHTGDVTINSGTYSFTGIGAGQAGVESGTGYGVFAGSGQNRVIVHGGTVTMVGKPDTDGTAIHGALDTSGYAGCSVKASLHSDGSGAEDYDAETLGYKYIRIWSPDDEVYDENGFEINGPGYQPAEQVNGVYQIKNAGNLFWFAEQVKDSTFGDALNAELTNNIVIPDARTWTAISLEDGSLYTGTFDGAGYTISGIRTNGTEGLFAGITADSVVKDLGIINSEINSGSSYGGAIAGTNYGIIENCYNTGTVMSEYGANLGVGGIAGWNYGTIRKCYNTGSITNAFDGAGGICGCICEGAVVEDCYNTGKINSLYDAAGIAGSYYDTGFTIKNCYNAGKISAGSEYWHEIASPVYNPAPEGDITNCYYLGDAETEDGGKTAAQFASGEVAYLLNAERSEIVWGQTLGTQAMPVLGGAPVYRGYAYCYSEDISYSNDASAVSETKPEHSFTVLKCDEENHWYACATEGCPEIYGTEKHKGGEATYYRGPLCEVCDTEYDSPKVSPLDSVSDITEENLTVDDKEQLEEAKTAVEQELAENGAGYTETQTEELEARIEEIAGLIKMIENAETAEEAIAALPDSVGADDTETAAQVNAAKVLYDGLTDAEKTLVSSDAVEKLNSLLAQLEESEKDTTGDTTSPQTEDNSNIVFWTAVMLASGTVLIGTVLYNRKRKYSR